MQGDLKINDNHIKRECVILKMTQLFSKDEDRPAELQIRKTEFNLQKGKIYIYYHYREGKITSNMEEYERDKLITNSKGGDINEKDTEESKE